MIARILALALLLSPPLLSAQTVTEKRSALTSGQGALRRNVSKELRHFNARSHELQEELRALYAQVPELYAEDADDDDYAYLIEQIRLLRDELTSLQEQWRHQVATDESGNRYALWHQPWTTIEQLIIDYGADDYVYLIAPEIGDMRLNVASNLPIPPECWDELLQLILTQNGVGMRQLNPLLRELYMVNAAPGAVIAVTADRADLALYRASDRICFVLTPPAANVYEIRWFLERFVNDVTATIMRFGRQIFVLATVEEIQELLKIYDFADIGTDAHEYQLVSLSKTTSKEMEAMVRLYFEREEEGGLGGLKVMAAAAPSNALFMAGSAEMVRQARRLIEGVEAQIADPREIVIYTYTARHSEVEELAEVLSKVYALMLTNPGAGLSAESLAEKLQGEHRAAKQNEKKKGSDPDLAIHPAPVTAQLGPQEPKSQSNHGNFVVSPKTGTLIMVVEQDLLSQLKSLLRKLDVPKRMVKIDVLLFEKRVVDQSRFGLDLLRLGSASNANADRLGFSFHGGRSKSHESGLVQFLVSRTKGSLIPAFDLVYDFLMAREDIRINASPSVTTVNNTEAKIELVEEISIDNGTFIDPDLKDNLLKRSFTRTQYGITIQITPSINAADCTWGGGPEYITLDTSVLFDTPRPSNDNRPPVIRRRITNQVRIANGQTVVLGGLRSKMCEDTDSGLPFLSEIPCFGKIFGSTRSSDRDTEMFVFITPTIIEDPASELGRLQQEMLSRRPGDLPEFLERVEYARRSQQVQVFERSFKTLFGNTDDMPCSDRWFP